MNGIRRNGFTLIELMAVIAIIALVSAMVLPTAARMFSATSLEQARQTLSATLTGARAAAIEHAEYRIVHVQVGHEGSTWICSMAGRDEGLGQGMRFGGEGIVWPRRIPGRIAFGGIAPGFLTADGANYKPFDPPPGLTDEQIQELADAELEDFTSFNIGFSPEGQVITSVGDADKDGVPDLALDGISPVFGWLTPDGETQSVWKTCPPPEPGVRAVTYFPYPKVKALPAWGDPGITTRAMYLDGNAQFIALSPLTGRVMDAK